MEHDVPPLIYLLGIGIPVLGSIAVTLLSKRSGERLAAKDEPFTPHEHGEHAHTRDIIKDGVARILDRIEASDTARGLRAQSDQRGLSARRLLDGEDGE